MSELVNIILLIIWSGILLTINIFFVNYVVIIIYILCTTSIYGICMLISYILKLQQEPMSFIEMASIESQDECVVCLELMTSNVVKLQNCNHKFHDLCIQGWIDSTCNLLKQCPLCRKTYI
jgi:hypothetical protein